MVPVSLLKQKPQILESIRPCHTVAILSRETKRALFYHAKPCSGKTKLFWSQRTIWPPCDKGKLTNKSRLMITLTNVG